MKINRLELGSEIIANGLDRISDCDRSEVVELTKSHGWVHFRGFDISLADFEAFTASFGTCTETRIVHYPPGGVALGFHAEDAYNPYRPDAIWFLCLDQGSHGGMPTGVLDGVRLLAEMDDELSSLCRTETLRFDRQWSADTWQPILGTKNRNVVLAALQTLPGIASDLSADGILYVGFETPMVHQTPLGQTSFSNTILHAVKEPSYYGMTLGSGAPLPSWFPQRVEHLALKIEHGVGWNSGEFAVVDNFRMMHRRGEYHGTGRDLRVRHCENYYGSPLADVSTKAALGLKRLIQGDEGSPSGVGMPAEADAV